MKVMQNANAAAIHKEAGHFEFHEGTHFNIFVIFTRTPLLYSSPFLYFFFADVKFYVDFVIFSAKSPVIYDHTCV